MWRTKSSSLSKKFRIICIFRRTKKTIGLGFVSHFLQLLFDIKSMAEIDVEIGEILAKLPQWEPFKLKYIQRQGEREDIKFRNNNKLI